MRRVSKLIHLTGHSIFLTLILSHKLKFWKEISWFSSKISNSVNNRSSQTVCTTCPVHHQRPTAYVILLVFILLIDRYYSSYSVLVMSSVTGYHVRTYCYCNVSNFNCNDDYSVRKPYLGY